MSAWQALRGSGSHFFAIDDPDRLRKLASDLGWEIPIAEISGTQDTAAVFPDALPVFARRLPYPVVPGHGDSRNGRVVIDAIETAVQMATAGQIGGLVTNPINKAVLYGAGFTYPGHTEFLTALAGVETPLMMLANSELRVVPVSIHESLRNAVVNLSIEAIVRKGRITDRALREDFGIAEPRLAVAGLNPHAGEGGAMGTEEQTIVRPAIDILRSEGVSAIGPMPPDTMFHAAARSGYDAAICMYHDQALIPLKTIDFDGGVNVTLGLPFVRTSPDHGTAFDIAGTGKANPESLIAAIRLASDIAANRARLRR